MSNPLAIPDSWDLVVADYAECTLPFFTHYAEAALDRTAAAAGMRVVDIAAGPGTLALAAARRGCRVTAIDFAPKMIDELRAAAGRSGLEVVAQVGDGQATTLPGGAFDRAYSMFGLMFFPDRAKGLGEMARLLVPGGIAAIATWQPMERFPMLNDIFAAIRTLLPGLPFGGGTAPLGEPADIVSEMTAAGFEDVRVGELAFSAQAPTLDEAWTFLRRGSAPFALLQKRLGESDWNELVQGIYERLLGKYGPGPQTLVMVANLGWGRRPAC